jgi:hypothetical protein
VRHGVGPGVQVELPFQSGTNQPFWLVF